MRNISICDISVRKSEQFAGTPLPFRIKIEVAKYLSKLGVSVIEAAPIMNGKTDYFLVKSLASAVSDSTVAVPVDILNPDSISLTWDALKEAKKPRLQVPVPVSTVQMEYFCHKKPASIIELISSQTAACAALCQDVEFVAVDFGRSEDEFLLQAINAAVDSGATIVTVSDVAGTLLPDEFYANIKRIKDVLPENIRLGVYCSNDLFLADACAIAAVRAGADEIKTISYGASTVSLDKFPFILNQKSDLCGAECSVRLTELKQVIGQIHKICDACVSKASTAVSVDDYERDGIVITNRDSITAVLHNIGRLGYDLSEDDSLKVYDALMRLTSGNGVVGAKEIDAIVASVAYQVPVTYRIESFVINTGNLMTPTCHIRIRKGDDILESVCLGDGPVDAAFLAIDQVIGKHYELEDYQVRAITEGREAMGETIVRLRYDGRVYSGRGVSKDIVESSLIAYLNAVNKIAYEEEQQ
ncbi:MAG: alpha-isopropylmalate synthase regulatory domain-containing protein [Bacteroidia bacterium]|nr:alpha-isopropylmalate synthase regulatory domain-containing protein [Bacteroidia bacterium]